MGNKNRVNPGYQYANKGNNFVSHFVLKKRGAAAQPFSVRCDWSITYASLNSFYVLPETLNEIEVFEDYTLRYRTSSLNLQVRKNLTERWVQVFRGFNSAVGPVETNVSDMFK